MYIYITGIHMPLQPLLYMLPISANLTRHCCGVIACLMEVMWLFCYRWPAMHTCCAEPVVPAWPISQWSNCWEEADGTRLQTVSWSLHASAIH